MVPLSPPCHRRSAEHGRIRSRACNGSLCCRPHDHHSVVHPAEPSLRARSSSRRRGLIARSRTRIGCPGSQICEHGRRLGNLLSWKVAGRVAREHVHGPAVASLVVASICEHHRVRFAQLEVGSPGVSRVNTYAGVSLIGLDHRREHGRLGRYSRGNMLQGAVIAVGLWHLRARSSALLLQGPAGGSLAVVHQSASTVIYALRARSAGPRRRCPDHHRVAVNLPSTAPSSTALACVREVAAADHKSR